jgi:hypothetical protein
MGEKRANGSGKLRLGSILPLNEGIYSVLYIANFKREYFKLSLHNEQVKLTLTFEVPPKNSGITIANPRKLTGHRKAFKGVIQSIKSDEG